MHSGKGSKTFSAHVRKTKYIIKSHILLFLEVGKVAYAYHPCYLRSWGKWVSWAQKFGAGPGNVMWSCVGAKRWFLTQCFRVWLCCGSWLVNSRMNHIDTRRLFKNFVFGCYPSVLKSNISVLIPIYTAPKDLHFTSLMGLSFGLCTEFILFCLENLNIMYKALVMLSTFRGWLGIRSSRSKCSGMLAKEQETGSSPHM